MADKSEPKTVKAPLASAAASTDPAVHHALAELQTAKVNGDADAEKAAAAKLTGLGYE